MIRMAATFFVLGALMDSASADMKYLSIGKIASVTLGPGKPAEVVVPVIVAKEFHVQANPASSPRLIATTLEVSGTDALKAGTPVYPAGKAYKLQGAAMEISVYDGKFEIKVPLFAQASVKSGRHELKGKLRFQACNDKICFFPMNIPVTIPVTVQK